jgi:hypothetical protein
MFNDTGLVRNSQWASISQNSSWEEATLSPRNVQYKLEDSHLRLVRDRGQKSEICQRQRSESVTVFSEFHKQHTNILLPDFNAKVGREDIFKPEIWN